MKSLKTIMNPAHYQGHKAAAPYFEGWYYKLISADRQRRYAIIPGISLSDKQDEPHSFIQVLNGSSGETAYYQFPVSAFSASRDNFSITIDGNHFTETSMHLDLVADSMNLRGDLNFTGIKPWPVTLTSPGIMGWYAWVPRMECYHGVVSLDHVISGHLQHDGKDLVFDNGRGYIEKDWGQAFPTAWVWMQSNHFHTPGTSLTASVAMIPWMGRAFRGLIIGLLHDEHLYRFATYTGARIQQLEVVDNTVTWVVRDRHHELSIHAVNGQAGELRGPSQYDMGRRVPESLQAVIEVRLIDIHTRQVLYAGSGECGGLELGGQVNTLLST